MIKIVGAPHAHIINQHQTNISDLKLTRAFKNITFKIRKKLYVDAHKACAYVNRNCVELN